MSYHSQIQQEEAAATTIPLSSRHPLFPRQRRVAQMASSESGSRLPSVMALVTEQTHEVVARVIAGLAGSFSFVFQLASDV